MGVHSPIASIELRAPINLSDIVSVFTQLCVPPFLSRMQAHLRPIATKYSFLHVHVTNVRQDLSTRNHTLLRGNVRSSPNTKCRWFFVSVPISNHGLLIVWTINHVRLRRIFDLVTINQSFIRFQGLFHPKSGAK